MITFNNEKIPIIKRKKSKNIKTINWVIVVLFFILTIKLYINFNRFIVKLFIVDYLYDGFLYPKTDSVKIS